MMSKYKNGMVISYILSALFIGLGFYKMFVYENPKNSYFSTKEPVNAYVGGDAYNYIINSNYATAYFTLAIFCAVIGLTCLVANHLELTREANSNKFENEVEYESINLDT